jgi:hypothetical protein
MAEGHRMTAAELVDKLLADEHADVLRDGVAWLVTQLMEAEVGGLTGAELGERAPTAARPSATATGRGAGTPGSASWSWPSKAADWVLLPQLSGATPTGRTSPGRGGAGGLCQRRLDRQGRPAGRPAGAARDEQGHRQSALPRPRRTGHRVL